MAKKALIIVAAIIFFLVMIFSSIVNLTFDYLWFLELGYKNIFTTILSTQLLIGVAGFVVSFILIYTTFKIAHFLTRKKEISSAITKQGIDLNKYINKLLLAASLVLGFFISISLSANWEVVLQYLNSTSFGTQDPIFKKDISFYFFTLPFYKLIINTLYSVLIISLIGTAIIYLIKGILKLPKQFTNQFSQFNVENVNEEATNDNDAKKAKIHLSVIAALLFLLTAARLYFVKINELVYSNTGPFTGASYTDVHATLPLYKVLVTIALIGFILSIISIGRKKNKFIIAGIGLYFVASTIGFVYPSIIQKFIVVPNELSKESLYIENNIKATQEAWNIDQVEKRELSTETSLNMNDIKENELTIKNIRLWDREPLLDTFSQIQEIRTYYDFMSIDDDRYTINGEYRQVMTSPRELNTLALPHRTFINEHLSFTHGYGLTLGPVNQVTKEGLPLLFVKDIPPTSDIESLQIKRPEIYFGEIPSDFAFVNTKAQEFDYPKGDENVFAEFKGNSGIKVDSIFKKALLAIKFNSLKTFLSNDITNDSQALYYRNIDERVKKVLPFLTFDSDPYIIVTDEGELKWIYDAYVSSNLYPNSQKMDGINYMRNSVKIVIDAYSGKMDFYIAEKDDPVIQTYAKIFNDTFKDMSEMSQDLKSHVRYPQDIFEYQTELFQTYHMEQAQVFYNKEDMWEIPTLDKESSKTDPMMRHLIMKLPGEEKEEFIFMVPYTPRHKDNMSAWMVARNDGDNYGKLVIYRFPKQKLIYGPKQINNRISQDPTISEQVSLWDQRGSEVISGNLFVIPIKESILYVQPLYLRAEGGKIPELKRVVVAFENKISMEKTLDEALSKIFEGKIETTTTKDTKETTKEVSITKTTETNEELIQQANEHYVKAEQAQKDGDWALYGEEIEKLGEILEKLNQ
ncbi:MAG: UPF0182 family protein [Parcubacteria group bacterium]|nr:UPF0182 family protein [Parcubacteria group bacterium]